MEDCSYLRFLDYYRVCVKKKEFLQTAFCCDECDVWRCEPARVGEHLYI